MNRQGFIGGSDLPAIVGTSTFTTAFDLLLIKAGLEREPFNGNCYTIMGNIFEDKLVNWKNIPGNQKEFIGELENFPIKCHVDGYNPETNELYEIKTSSLTQKQLIFSYFPQIQMYLLLSGTKYCNFIQIVRKDNEISDKLKDFMDINDIPSYTEYIYTKQQVKGLETALNSIFVNTNIETCDIIEKKIYPNKQYQEFMLKKLKLFINELDKLENNPELAQDTNYFNEINYKFTLDKDEKKFIRSQFEEFEWWTNK